MVFEKIANCNSESSLTESLSLKVWKWIRGQHTSEDCSLNHSAVVTASESETSMANWNRAHPSAHLSKVEVCQGTTQHMKQWISILNTPQGKYKQKQPGRWIWYTKMFSKTFDLAATAHGHRRWKNSLQVTPANVSILPFPPSCLLESCNKGIRW